MVRVPYAPEPLACWPRSGMRSRFWWASFSNRMKSCISTGPRGPAVILFWLSETGMPESVVRMGRLATECSCVRDTEFPAQQPLYGSIAFAFAPSPLDRVRQRDSREYKTYEFVLK